MPDNPEAERDLVQSPLPGGATDRSIRSSSTISLGSTTPWGGNIHPRDPD